MHADTQISRDLKVSGLAEIAIDDNRNTSSNVRASANGGRSGNDVQTRIRVCTSLPERPPFAEARTLLDVLRLSSIAISARPLTFKSRLICVSACILDWLLL